MVEKRFEKLGMPDIERFENYLPTAFNSELTLLQKVNKIIFDLIETNKLTNEMVDYLNNFIETFDEKLYKTIKDVLQVWLEDGLLADVVREAINEEVVEARGGFIDLNHRLINIDDKIDMVLIRRDTSFTDLETAFSYCNVNNITLVLTKNHTLTSVDPKELIIPNIIGNGFSIFLDNVHFTTNKKVSINGVKFYHKSLAENTLQSYCLKTLHTTIVIGCYFRGFYSPCLIQNGYNNIVESVVIERCMQGVYLSNTKYSLITNVYFNNSQIDNIQLNNMTGKIEGYDGFLIENSSHVSIDSCVVEWTIERALYSSDSDNVTFTNNIINNSKCVKFCGYTSIRKSFICSNIVVNNSFDDAFCQLYQCENIQISDINIVNNSDSNVGWLIRMGQNIRDLYVTNVKANRIRRNIVSWEENFPKQINGACTVKNILLENVNCTEIGLIRELSYPLFEFKYTTYIENQIQNLTVKNCALLRSSEIEKDDITDNVRGFSYVLSANTISNVLFKDNTIVGYGANISEKCFYPMLITGSYNKITIITKIRTIRFKGSQLPSIKLTSDSELYVTSNSDVLKEITRIQSKSINGEEVNISTNYIIEREVYNVDSTIFTSFKNSDLIYIDVYSDGEKGFIAYNGVFNSIGENVATGSWLSDGKIRLYVDSSDSSIINLRCSQSKKAKILISIQSN